MVLVAYMHGLRVSKLVDLRWEQVDLRTATLHVRRVKKGTLERQRESIAKADAVQGSYRFFIWPRLGSGWWSRPRKKNGETVLFYETRNVARLKVAWVAQLGSLEAQESNRRL
jgi:integrase